MSTQVYECSAFTARGTGGNPAGVVFAAEGLSDEKMLAIAAKGGFSETAFVTPSTVATYRLRFFTPTKEVDLCGHASIATWALLHQLGDIQSGNYTQETRAGVLRITINAAGRVFLEQAEAAFFETVRQAEIAPMLGLTMADFDPRLLSQVVSTGLRDIMVPLQNAATLASIQPAMAAIAKLSQVHAVTGLHVFALTPATQSIASVRNFSPLVGIPEEAATGTANGALLSYLRAQQVIEDHPEYRIEQGVAMGRLSYIYGTFTNNRVFIGGTARLLQERAL